MIWTLFAREEALYSRPKHLLCDGFRKGAPSSEQAAYSIPGVYIRFPNPQVKTLKSAPWPQVLALLGQSGERIMIDLLVDSSIFIAVDAGYGNYFQVSGRSTCSLSPMRTDFARIPPFRNAFHQRRGGNLYSETIRHKSGQEQNLLRKTCLDGKGARASRLQTHT